MCVFFVLAKKCQTKKKVDRGVYITDGRRPRPLAFCVKKYMHRAAPSYDPALNDGEVDARSRRISALEWLTSRTFGAASVVFATLLIIWTAVLVIGFEFFFRDIVVGHGIDAAFSSFGLIIGIIYGDFYKEWRLRKRAAIEQYFRARLELKEQLFSAVRTTGMTRDNALLYLLALYQAFNRHHIEAAYRTSMEAVYEGSDKKAMETALSDHAAFLSDFIAHKDEPLPSAPAVAAVLATHVVNAKLAVDVPEPGIYRLHTFFLFFVALFVLYPFATWVAVGPVLATVAVPFVLFVLFVPFIVDLVIGDPWHPDREVDIGPHEQWFRNDVAEVVKYL